MKKQDIETIRNQYSKICFDIDKFELQMHSYDITKCNEKQKYMIFAIIGALNEALNDLQKMKDDIYYED